MKNYSYNAKAFTLAELLIALAILGVIATFTILKILDSGTSGKYNALAKEVAATISGAYQNYKLANGASTAMSPDDLTSYINYVSVYTLQRDAAWTDAGETCTGIRQCYVLHNGGVLGIINNQTFNESDSTNALWFEYIIEQGFKGDKDQGIRFYLYYNGRIQSFGTIESNTCNSSTCWNPVPAHDPPWFSWSN